MYAINYYYIADKIIRKNSNKLLIKVYMSMIKRLKKFINKLLVIIIITSNKYNYCYHSELIILFKKNIIIKDAL